MSPTVCQADPGTTRAGTAPAAPPRGWNDHLVGTAVLAAIAILFLACLGSLGLFDPDEGRYAAIPTAMLRSGDLLVPHLQGFPYLEKPPLLYWLTAGTIAAFGRNEFGARLPVAVLGFAGVAALFWLALRTRGPRVAWLSAALLALCMQWFVQARFLTTDMVLAGLLALGLSCFYRGAQTGRASFFMLMYVCVGLATMTKGIIGFLLPGMIVLVFIVLTRRWRLLLEIRPWWGVLIVAAIVVPWFALVQARYPVFLKYFIVDQHLARFVSERAEHERPFWFFVPVVVLGFFPWVTHLPFLRRRDDISPSADSRDLWVFLWTWFLVIFGFFSMSSGKLMSYVLPAFPPLALLTAELFARLWDPGARADSGRRVLAASVIVGAIWLVMAPAALVGLPWLVRRDGRIALEDVVHWPWIFATIWGLGGLAVLVTALSRRPRAALLAQVVAMLALFFTMIGAAKAVEPFMNPKPLGKALARVVKPSDVVAIYRIPEPSIEFYIDRPPMLIGFAGEYRFGISLEPNPDYYREDGGELSRLFASDRQVYAVCDKDDRSLPASLPQPVGVLVQTEKRAVYRNFPGITGRAPPLADR